MVVVPIALSEKRKRGDGSLPEWAALEFQGELKKWKEKRGGQGSLEDDAIAKDPSDLKLFSSSFIPGLKFGLFQVDPKVSAEVIVTSSGRTNQSVVVVVVVLASAFAKQPSLSLFLLPSIRLDAPG